MKRVADAADVDHVIQRLNAEIHKSINSKNFTIAAGRQHVAQLISLRKESFSLKRCHAR